MTVHLPRCTCSLECRAELCAHRPEHRCPKLHTSACHTQAGGAWTVPGFGPAVWGRPNAWKKGGASLPAGGPGERGSLVGARTGHFLMESETTAFVSLKLGEGGSELSQVVLRWAAVLPPAAAAAPRWCSLPQKGRECAPKTLGLLPNPWYRR